MHPNLLRQNLPKVWGAFYGRFFKPQPIQLEAAAPLLGGENGLLVSATASGKTEAYAAPLVERHWDDLRARRLTVLIITPTRALANDLQARLLPPLERCKVKVTLRTGDHPLPLREGAGGVLVTTLESLDSLLCRYPAQLLGIKSVVLEELHVVDGTPRGDQLSILLERLDTLLHSPKACALPYGLGGLGLPLQRVAVSATPGCGAEIVSKYLGGRGQIISIPQERRFVAQLVHPKALEGEESPAQQAKAKLEAIISFCLEEKAPKMLVFVSSRAEAELLVAAAANCHPNPFGAAVYSHHSSLSSQARERVEEQFAQQTAALCCATSTLEVGIDIGDIDGVAFTAPNADLNSFWQRLGRSGRRGQVTKFLGLYGDYWQELQYRHLLEAARAGQSVSEHPPFCTSVLIQQSLSLVCQNPRHLLTPKALLERLPAYLQGRYSSAQIGRLYDHLASEGWLRVERRGESYAWGPKLEELFTRGEMHHNIARGGGGGGYQVLEGRQNVLLGEISGQRGWQVGDYLRLGGRTYKVVRLGAGRQLVVAAQAGVPPQLWRSCEFQSAGGPRWGRAWTRDLGRYLGFPEGETLWTQPQRGEWLYSHFWGSWGGSLLAACLQAEGYPEAKANPYVLSVGRPLEVPQRYLSPLSWKLSLKGLARELRSRLDLGPWSYLLTPELLAEDLERWLEWLELESAWRLLARPHPAEAQLSRYLCAAASQL